MEIMRKYFLLTVVLLLTCACGSEPEAPSKPEAGYLTGTKWKLAGIVDIETGELTELEPKDCAPCFTLSFDTDGTFSIYSPVGVYGGCYSADYEIDSLLFSLALGPSLISLLSDETDDAALFVRNFWGGRRRPFSFQKNELKLYDKFWVGAISRDIYFLYKPCEPCEEDINSQSLASTFWKVMGRVDTESGVLTALEPQYCNYYSLWFKRDSRFYTAATNSYVGFYYADYSSHTLCLDDIGGTARVERGDEVLYIQTLQAVQSFSLHNNELKLYYNDNKGYLLCKPWKSWKSGEEE